MFSNIKIAFYEEGEISSSETSVLRIELNLFEATQASEGSPCDRKLTWADIFFELPCRDESGGNCCPYW